MVAAPAKLGGEKMDVLADAALVRIVVLRDEGNAMVDTAGHRAPRRDATQRQLRGGPSPPVKQGLVSHDPGPKEVGHSWRSASIGLSREAFLAG